MIMIMVAAAGSPAFAGPPAGGFVLHTNQERIVRHTNQDMQGMTGLTTLPRDHVPWLGPFDATDTLAMSPGTVTGLPPAAPLLDVPVGVRALPETWAHGNSPRAVGSIPAPATLPVLGLAVLARGGRTRRRLNRACTVGCVK